MFKIIFKELRKFGRKGSQVPGTKVDNDPSNIQMEGISPKPYVTEGRGVRQLQLREGRKNRNGQDSSTQVKHVLIRRGRGILAKNLSCSVETLNE